MPFLKKAISHLFTLRIIEGPLAIRKKVQPTNAQSLKAKGAFTLIEILVVVGIMAVMASTILYSTNNARDKGKDSRRKTDLKAVAGALVSYYADKGHYPPTDLVANPFLDYVSYPYNSGTWIPDLTDYINGGKLPKDPLQASISTYVANALNSLGKLASNLTRPIGQTNKGQVAGTTSIGFDNKSEANSSSVQTLNVPHSLLGTGTNRLLVVSVAINNVTGLNVSTVTYGATNLTFLGSQAGGPLNSGIRTEMWYATLGNAAASTANITVNLSAVTTSGFYIAGTSWTGVKQATPFIAGSFISTTGSTATASLNVPSAADHVVIDAIGSNPPTGTTATFAPGAGQTSIFSTGTNSFGLAGSSKGSTSATTPISYTVVAAPWAYAAATLNSDSITATSTTVTSSVAASADDGKYIPPVGPNPAEFKNDITDAPVGNAFETCGRIRNSFLRFTNVNIPAGRTIQSASITFAPRTAPIPYSDPQPDSYYQQRPLALPSTIPTKLFAQKVLNPDTVNDATDWASEINQAQTQIVNWDVEPWYPSPPASRLTKDITSIIQDLYSNVPGWAGSNQSILLFWVDNGTPVGSCAGRMGVSYDGSVADPSDPNRPYGAAPRIDITYSDAPPPTTCTDPAATNFGGPLPCTYPPPSSASNTACNNFATNVYCYRTSQNQKVFVLWTKLENANDPELSTNANALCQNGDADFTTSTSPYYGMGLPTSSAFNYCIKSPQ